MKNANSSVVLSILSFALLSTISWATSSQTNVGNFLQCLTRVSPNAASISQVIYTPSNSSYTSILQSTLQNLRFASSETPKPLVIVTPVDESQIQTVIYCCKKTNIQMRIRGAGHDFEGVSYVSQVPFVMLDMFNLRSIDVDPVAATAWIQAGTTLGEVYYAIAQKSKTLSFPAGVWSTVGATGLIGGGGYGILRRKYGLAADNVLDARMIDVNGRILNRKSMGEDLFWAIRGGGVSSFGVILSWKLNLVSVPEMVTLFDVGKTLEQNGTDIVYRWQTVAPKLPKEVEIRLVANTIKIDSPPEAISTVLSESSRTQNAKTIRFRFVGSFLGGIDKFLPLIDQSFPELGLKREDCNQVSYIQAVLAFSLISTESPPEALLERTSFKIPFKAKSDYVKQPIAKEGLNGMWDRLLQTEPQTTNLILTSYGGRMDEISESSIPFPHRAGTLYMMYMRVLIMNGDTTKALHWIRGLYSYLTPYTAPRTAYVNYNDFDLGVNNLLET